MAEVLTLEQIKKLLHYDPITGIFYWKQRKSWAWKNSPIAGDNKNCAHINGHAYSLTKLAIFYTTGKMPKYLYRHINGNRFDNRITNGAMPVASGKARCRMHGGAAGAIMSRAPFIVIDVKPYRWI